MDVYRNLFLLMGILLHGWTASADTLPVLPYPQQVVIRNEQSDLSARFHLQGIGLNKSIVDRLNEHWKNFTSDIESLSSGQNVAISLILTGMNKRGDALVQQYAGTTADKIGKEGYILVINNRHRFIAARSETGLFYGLQTLKQLTRNHWGKAVTIIDWPAFSTRVVFDDISRGPVPTVAYIKQQIERMAALKINYLSFYIEHVVETLSHPDFAPENGKLTIAQIRELSAYAARYHMQLIGSFQSFGHFEKILSLPQYRSMGETSSLISPLDPKARQFLSDVIGELCDAFSAPWFNVNCDETFNLGKGRSKAYVDSVGVSRFYADHLRFLHDVVKKHGKRMMMWGDIAMQHEEVLDLLPRDVIYLTWEYGDQPDYDRWIQPFAKRQLEFMVCAGVLNSYRMFPDMLMAKANIASFFRQGKRDGATGAFATIWDDGGAYLFPADWYGVYMSAEKSWNVDTTQIASFNERYEKCAYGSANGNYVKALFTLMKLRTLPLTYNLNDQLWHQQILPDSGKKLILNNESAPEALQVIRNAMAYITAADARYHLSDVSVLQYAIRQYKLIITTRLIIADVVKRYADAAAMVNTAPQETIKILQAAADTLHALKQEYETAAGWFRQAWLRENQPYWLDVVLQPYNDKIENLSKLEYQLRQAAIALPMRHALPAPSVMRLNILVTDRFYFKNWLLSGPFPVDTYAATPAFLYAPDAKNNVPPAPGELLYYRNKTYHWEKFPAMNGGIIDLDNKYHYKDSAAAVYAYCQLHTDSAFDVNAYLLTDDSTMLYCNGIRCEVAAGAAGEEKLVRLPLQAGVNHLLLKVFNKEDRPWDFTFRLQDNIAVSNHKHKYQLNAKSNVYEVD